MKWTDVQRKNPSPLNLSYAREISLPVKKAAKALIVIFLAAGFLSVRVHAPVSSAVAAEDKISKEERAALENQLSELEKQIGEYETLITQYRKQGQGLQSEIKSLNAKIAKLNLQIKAVNITLNKLASEISVTESNISTTQDKINLNKQALSQAIQLVYENESKGLMEILLENPDLSDFFDNLNNLAALQVSVKSALQVMNRLKNELMDQKEQLALEKADAEALRRYQTSQRESISKTQNDKDVLLKTTKGKESTYKELLTETQKTAAQIRSRIFELLGGGEMTFEEAYQFAKFAEQATGVRAALILSVLDKESALGRNVGRCSYKTAMHPERDLPVFLAIVNELGLNPDLVQVSCPITSDGAFGGAMGPAQFLPSTWNLYKEKIKTVSGSNPPSPWRNADAFIATALYLKDAGAAGGDISKEREAAARYYAGGRWKRYLWTYGDRVVTRAQQFQRDIDILNS